MAAVKAIADLATMETSDVVAAAYADEKLRFGPDYLIPKAFDPRLIEVVPMAVVKAAMASGVATRPIEDLESYRQTLHEFVNQAGLFMQPIIELAKKAPARIVYAEGDNDDVLMAIQAVLDENVPRLSPPTLPRPRGPANAGTPGRLKLLRWIGGAANGLSPLSGVVGASPLCPPVTGLSPRPSTS